MNLAVLRVEGKNDALNGLLGRLRLKTTTVWNKGDSRRRGGIHEESGFTSTIADTNSPRDMVIAVRRFLATCCEQAISFPDQGLAAELSVGVTVGGSEQFVASIDLTPGDLSMMSSLGLSLDITAYPTSDESNVASTDVE
jgi:hypothetical protein